MATTREALEQDAEERLLKISELAEESGVPPATIKHYLREGLLPEPVKTSRNMSWYPESFVERVRLIKRLQEERFMPLRVIRSVLESNPDWASGLLDLEDRIIQRAIEQQEGGRMSRAEVERTYELPRNVLDRLTELGVLTPNSRGYDFDDRKIIEALVGFRSTGFLEQIGFTVYDFLPYMEALQPLVETEIATLFERLVGKVPPEEALKIIAGGAEPLRDLVGALHSKLLLAELRRGG